MGMEAGTARDMEAGTARDMEAPGMARNLEAWPVTTDGVYQ